MTLLIASLVFVGGGAALLWRLSSCPVLRTLRRGMGSWAARCEEVDSKPTLHPTYRPHDPFPSHEPTTVHAARRVA